MKVSLFFAKAQKWATGVGANAAALNLVHLTAGIINSALGNARQTELEYQIARSATLAASNSVQSARATAVLFIEKTRTNLKNYLGERWSTAWVQAGFKNNSLQIPKTNTAGVLDLARALQNYLLANAGHQNALAGVTSAAAGTQVTALDNAQKLLDTARRNQRTRRDGRNSTHENLAEVLVNSRSELESVLDDNDPRWMDFIDEVPGDLTAPEAVSAIVAEQGLPGHVRLSFLDSLRADAYGVYVSYDGGETYEHVVTIHDTVADLELTPGANVKIRVKASNPAGQSAFSPVAEVTVPVALAAAA